MPWPRRAHRYDWPAPPDRLAVLEAQQNLSSLCRDRGPSRTERFEPNTYYGADQLLKRYAALSPDFRLPAVIPHGVFLDPGYVWFAERNADVAGVMVTEPPRRAAYAAATDKLVIPSASPYLYLLAMAEPVSGPRAGTLFFPDHSTHHVTSSADFQALADAAADLPAHLQPVTVCMYWRDVQLGYDDAFRRRGLRVVSAGHMYDPDFLWRLHHLLSEHAFAAGNSVGTHMFYAVASGCTYVHVGLRHQLAYEHLLEKLTAVDVPWVEPDLAVVGPAYEEFQGAFGAGEGATRADQLEVARYFLGADSFLPPEQLRSALRALAGFDRWGAPGRLRSLGARWTPVPPRTRRRAAAVRRRARGALSRRGAISSG